MKECKAFIRVESWLSRTSIANCRLILILHSRHGIFSLVAFHSDPTQVASEGGFLSIVTHPRVQHAAVEAQLAGKRWTSTCCIEPKIKERNNPLKLPAESEKGASFHEKSEKNSKTNQGGSYQRKIKAKYKKPKTRGDKNYNKRNKRK